MEISCCVHGVVDNRQYWDKSMFLVSPEKSLMISLAKKPARSAISMARSFKAERIFLHMVRKGARILAQTKINVRKSRGKCARAQANLRRL